MKKIIPVIIVIGLMALLQGCATEKLPMRYDYAKPERVQTMGGTFNNDSRYNRLWTQLDYKALGTVCDSCQVKL